MMKRYTVVFDTNISELGELLDEANEAVARLNECLEKIESFQVKPRIKNPDGQIIRVYDPPEGRLVKLHPQEEIVRNTKENIEFIGKALAEAIQSRTNKE